MSKNSRGLFRMDFVMKNTEIIKEPNGKMIFKTYLIPDPERYEKKEEGGEIYYLDRFEGIKIPLKSIDEAASQLIGQPIYYSPPKIKDFKQYLSDRVPEIKKYLENPEEKISDFDHSEKVMEELEGKQLKFVILSFDLVESTKISEQLSIEQNSILISLLIRELTIFILNFNGFILKYTGDGLIAFFPEPNFVGMNDNALDCAVGIRTLILQVLNKILPTYNLPPIHFRIGIDSGYALIKALGMSGLKKQRDILGFTISIACKLGQLANLDEIIVGETATRNVHIGWRKNLEKINYSKEYREQALKINENYRIFKLKVA